MMLKKACLLVMVAAFAGLPLSAEVFIFNSDLAAFGIDRLTRDYDQTDGTSHSIVFDITDIPAYNAAATQAYLKSSVARSEINSAALAFLYNEVGHDLLDEGYEVVYFSLIAVGLADEISAKVRGLAYIAVLATPTGDRLAARQNSANADDPFPQKNQNLSGEPLTGELLTGELKPISSAQLERYLAENQLTALSGHYQKGASLEFAATGLLEFDYDTDEGQSYLIDSINPLQINYLAGLSPYQALMAAGYVLINLEIMSINYNPRTHEVGKVKYRAILAKE